MIDWPTIRALEEAALNAWPALQQILVDGWLVRFANGYTKRANSVNPFYESTQPVEAKIERCLALFQVQNLPPVFRLTPLAQPDDLDNRLAQMGFSEQSRTSVQTLDLAVFTTRFPSEFQYEASLSAAWARHFARLNNLGAHQDAHNALLRQIIPQTCFAVLHHHGQVVACGLAVREGAYVGLFDIVVDSTVRRRGFGRTLVLSLLAWARQQGATTAYLQVMTTNTPALNLYHTLGFREVYQYWYRLKEA